MVIPANVQKLSRRITNLINELSPSKGIMTIQSKRELYGGAATVPITPSKPGIIRIPIK